MNNRITDELQSFLKDYAVDPTPRDFAIAQHFYDLALTWEDVRSLHIIFDAIDVDIELGASDIKKETIGYYKEALRRFNEYKQKTK